VRYPLILKVLVAAAIQIPFTVASMLVALALFGSC